MKKVVLILLMVIFFVTGIVLTAHAHRLWINASNYFPSAGENVTIEIGFGHKYPNIEENIEHIFVLDPEGQELLLERIAPAKYRFLPKTKGHYEVIGHRISFNTFTIHSWKFVDNIFFYN